jgi:hypothetical protein
MSNQRLGSKVAPGLTQQPPTSHLTRLSRATSKRPTLAPLDWDGKWRIEMHQRFGPPGGGSL